MSTLMCGLMLLLGAPNCYIDVHITEGFVSAYDEVPSTATINFHIDLGLVTLEEVEEADMVIAIYSCSKVGDYVTVKAHGQEYRALVLDCAGDKDGGQAWMLRNGYVLEMFYATWQKFPELLGTYVEIEY